MSFTTGFGLYVSYGVEVSGGIDLDHLQAAFDELGSRHPALKAIIEDIDGVRVFTDSAATPTVIVNDAAETDDVLEGLTIRQDRNISGVYVQRYPNGHEVVSLLTHHGIADGHHSLALLEELWRLYVDSVAARGPHNTPDSVFPVSVETFLAGHGVTVDRRPSNHLDGEPDTQTDAPQQLPPSTFPMIRVELSEHETAQLIRNGRARGRTVNQMLSAALMKSAASAAGVRLPDMSFFYAVDVRRRVDPDTAFTSVTNALGFTGYRATESEIDTFDLAGRIGQSLKAGLASGAIQASPLDPAPVFTGRTEPSVILTNWGVVPRIARPDSLQVHNFHPRFHMEFGPDGLSPLADAGIPMAEIKQKLRPVVAVSFEGRLITDLVVNSPLVAAIAQRLPGELHSMI